MRCSFLVVIRVKIERMGSELKVVVERRVSAFDVGSTPCVLGRRKVEAKASKTAASVTFSSLQTPDTIICLHSRSVSALPVFRRADAFARPFMLEHDHKPLPCFSSSDQQPNLLS